MASEQKIGVAVVGTGFGQKIHIPGFKHHHRTEVVAVHNRDLTTAQEVANKYEIPHASDRLEEILALPEVTAVSVTTPPFLHYEMGKQVLEAGKHLLLEKPMAMNAGEVRELYQLAQSKNLIAMPDFEFRFIPAWQLLAEYLRQGYVGKTRLIKADWIVVSRADPNRPWNWYARQEMGGGALGAVGSHAFDYINWLFGEIKSLSAHLACAIPQRPDPKDGGQLKPVDADDTCLITMELADGTPCQVSISAVVFAPRTHAIEVYGDEGTLILASENQKDYVHGFRVWGAKAGKQLAEIEIPNRLNFPQNYADGRISGFIRVVDQWVQAITSGESITPSLREGVYSQLLMDMSHESNETSNWVNVPSFDVLLSM